MQEERRQSEMLGVETPSGSMQTSSQSTESDVVKTEMVVIGCEMCYNFLVLFYKLLVLWLQAQQGIVRKIRPISEDILPATGNQSKHIV